MRRTVVALCGSVLALLSTDSSAWAQSTPTIKVPGEDKFVEFCDAFELREAPFGDTKQLWWDQTYQSARDFINAASKTQSSKNRELEKLLREENDLLVALMDLDAKENEVAHPTSALSCPSGTEARTRCVIGGCSFVSGVGCEARDISSLVNRKDKLLTSLVKNLNRSVSLAATSRSKRQRAQEIKSALTGLKDNLLPRRKTFGVAYICEPSK